MLDYWDERSRASLVAVSSVADGRSGLVGSRSMRYAVTSMAGARCAVSVCVRGLWSAHLAGCLFAVKHVLGRHV